MGSLLLGFAAVGIGWAIWTVGCGLANYWIKDDHDE